MAAAPQSPEARPGPVAAADAGLRGRAEALGAGLGALLLAADRLAASALPGAHGERRAGQGEAFWQYRPALPGDSAAGIDWRRSARSDTLYLREREAQSPRQAALWVDQGAGMAWASAPHLPQKLDRARLVVLAFGLAALRGGERVGCLGQPVASGRVQAERLAAGLCAALPLAGGLRAGQRLVLASDWLGADLEALRELLARAAQTGLRGAILQVLDPAEAGFPFSGAVDFLDAAGRPAHRTRDAEGLRAAYLDRLAARQAELAAMAAAAGWQFSPFLTDEPPANALIWLANALAAA